MGPALAAYISSSDAAKLFAQLSQARQPAEGTSGYMTSNLLTNLEVFREVQLAG
jgi:hypothetical protein